MMDQLIARFTAQMTEALKIGRAAKITQPKNDIHKIYIAGLGGSGIGADFVASMIAEDCAIPYLVGKGYHIPKYIDKNTIAIASSYSGNTEETLSALEQMEQTGAKIICISSGGKLVERAIEKGYDYVQVPGNWPSPRACLGYSLIAQLCVLKQLGYIDERFLEEIEASVKLLDELEDEIQSKAAHAANYLNGKIPIVYIEDRMAPVATRFRQQINENAKMLGWERVIPEMNHNELVGWRDKNNDLAVVYLRNRDDYMRNAVRMDINKEIISDYTDTIMEIYSKGSSMVERMMYLVHLGDWITWHLSQLHGVDSIEVEVIDYLKSELGKVS